MPSTATSLFSSAPGTSQLDAPEEIQRPNDFESTRTERFTEGEENTEPRLDLARLQGYELAPGRKKLKSFIWEHGWRLIDEEGMSHWVCRHCHTADPKPKRPNNHLFKTEQQTSGPIYHLRDAHSIQGSSDTPVRRSRKAATTPSGGSRQVSITGFTSSSARGSEAPFNFDVFKGLLLQLFTLRSLPFELVEDKAFRSLLTYCQPLLNDCIPSRRTLRRYIEATYTNSLELVESHLQTATTKIHLSFDLWTSPGRRLSLLGVVAHYLDATFTPRAILLALPQMHGSHTAVNLSVQLESLLRQFKIESHLSNAITDNASENAACLDLLSDTLLINTRKRHVRCIGHIINLVAQEVLFGQDVESFEDSIGNITAIEVELAVWRKKGPIGRLHNLIRYICASEQRRAKFMEVQRKQPDAMRSERLRAKDAYDLKHDNLTRWNSWYDAAERALDLRNAIDELIEHELEDYYQKLARFNVRSASQSTSSQPPKEPTLLLDRLHNDDWHVIASYLKLMKPLKDATMKLQGNVNTTSKRGVPMKGAIWQVLPVFEEILKGFEEARERHQPTSQNTSQSTQSQQTPTETTQCQRNTQRGKPQARSSDSQMTETPAARSDEDITIDDGYTDQAVHFSTAINAAWQKLEYYYNKTDITLIHRAAVLLHPRMKWRWFERYWRTKPEWIADARLSIAELWSEYKDQPVTASSPTVADCNGPQDEWSSGTDEVDQLQMYEQEAHTEDPKAFDSPIPYWLGKRAQWPQLAQMALDIYSTPAMSDEPERVFSITGNVLSQRRRRLTSDAVQWLLCLRSWQNSEIIALDQRLLRRAVIEVDRHLPHGGDDDDDEITTPLIDPEVVDELLQAAADDEDLYT
jgi:hypothetical protein